MPVPSDRYFIEVCFPGRRNTDPAKILLYKILEHIGTAPNPRTVKHYQLLCKAVMNSYEVRTHSVCLDTLLEHYNSDGTPKSLQTADCVIQHQKFDAIECLTIIITGFRNVIKTINFEKIKGNRSIKFGRIEVPGLHSMYVLYLSLF